MKTEFFLVNYGNHHAGAWFIFVAGVCVQYKKWQRFRTRRIMNAMNAINPNVSTGNYDDSFGLWTRCLRASQVGECDDAFGDLEMFGKFLWVLTILIMATPHICWQATCFDEV